MHKKKVLVYPDGSVQAIPPASFEALCPLDLRYWPYDTQSCTLKIGSWTQDGESLEMSLLNNITEVYRELNDTVADD